MLLEDCCSPIDSTKPVNLSQELLVIDDYLPANVCSNLIAFANWSPTAPAPIGGRDVDRPVANVRSDGFVADRLEVCADPYVCREVLKISNDIFINYVNPNYHVKTEWYEMPHVLRYRIGGIYTKHSDSENFDKKNKRWVKVIDRDYSIIVYLNSDFDGGAIAFPSLNLRVQPRTGMLVTFPSDHRFLHTAESTLSGTRYALVTWGAIHGIERIADKPPYYIVQLD